ncbi:MAG TPA: calcium-binding protein, partial [Dongiaceae bacterium]|nr:calcium-binding protein [Dongiaceae bacterium]
MADSTIGGTTYDDATLGSVKADIIDQYGVWRWDASLNRYVLQSSGGDEAGTDDSTADADDKISGSINLNDLVFGGNGDDRIYGGKGSDRLSGENGNDILYGDWQVKDRTILAGTNTTTVSETEFLDFEYTDGDAGNDVLIGGNGEDQLYGGVGNDTLWGGSANDESTNTTENGKDMLFGGAGNDELHGGNGIDKLYGDGNGIGDDGKVIAGGAIIEQTLPGATYDDTLFGENGNDELFGQLGNDKLTGGRGADLLTGGPGDDWFIYKDVS